MADSPNQRAHSFFFGGGRSLGWWADLCLLGARVYAGYSISSGGLDKIPSTTWFAGQVESLGFPLPRLFAFAAAYSEFAGGIFVVLGLFSRISTFFIAVTMGVAAFVFHTDVPVFGIHVANLYFWLFVGLCGVGAGGLSADRILLGERSRSLEGAKGKQLWHMLALTILITTTAFAGYRELLFTPQVSDETSDSNEIESVSVAGSFNAWNVTSHPLTQDSKDKWSGEIALEKLGPIEFKFVVNESWDTNLGATNDAEIAFPLAGIPGILNSKTEPQNIKAYIPKPGLYLFSIDLESLEYSLVEWAQTVPEPTSQP